MKKKEMHKQCVPLPGNHADIVSFKNYQQQQFKEMKILTKDEMIRFTTLHITILPIGVCVTFEKCFGICDY